MVHRTKAKKRRPTSKEVPDVKYESKNLDDISTISKSTSAIEVRPYSHSDPRRSSRTKKSKIKSIALIKNDSDVEPETAEDSEYSDDDIKKESEKTTASEKCALILNEISKSDENGLTRHQIVELVPSISYKRLEIWMPMIRRDHPNKVCYFTRQLGRQIYQHYGRCDAKGEPIYPSDIKESLNDFKTLADGQMIEPGDTVKIANFKGKMNITDRSICRLVAILKILDERRVVFDSHPIKKALHHMESTSGRTEEIDKRSVQKLLKLLESRGLLKIFANSENPRTKTKSDFLCHRSIETFDDAVNYFLKYEPVEIESAPSKKQKLLTTIGKNIVIGEYKTPKDSTNEDIFGRNGHRFFLHLMQSEYKIEELTIEERLSLACWSANILKCGQADYNICDKPNEVIKRKMSRQFRLEILHQFLNYWIYNYTGNGPKFFQRICPLGIATHKLTKEDCCGEQPPPLTSFGQHVYADELTWRRYVPPPLIYKEGAGWFCLMDVALAMPLSLFCLLFRHPHSEPIIEKLLKEDDRRHMLVADLPLEIRIQLWFKRFFLSRLHDALSWLCVMGLATCRMANLGVFNQRDDERPFSRSNYDMFFLHRRSRLFDTSTVPLREAQTLTVPGPITEYQQYEYNFLTPKDITLYWLHFRLIAVSTPFKGMDRSNLHNRIKRTEADKSEESTNDGNTSRRHVKMEMNEELNESEHSAKNDCDQSKWDVHDLPSAADDVENSGFMHGVGKSNKYPLWYYVKKATAEDSSRMAEEGTPLLPRDAAAGFNHSYASRALNRFISVPDLKTFQWLTLDWARQVVAVCDEAVSRVSNLHKIWTAHIHPLATLIARNDPVIIKSEALSKANDNSDEYSMMKRKRLKAQTRIGKLMPPPTMPARRVLPPASPYIIAKATRNLQSTILRRETLFQNSNQRKRAPDERDQRVLASQTRQRSKFLQRERDMLVFLKALAQFLYPVNRLWVPPTIWRDIMHDHVPESRNKTAQALLAATTREIFRKTTRRRLLNAYIESMNSIDELVQIKNDNPIWKCKTEMAKVDVYLKAFEAANRLLFSNCEAPPSATMPGSESLESYLERHSLFGPRPKPDDDDDRLYDTEEAQTDQMMVPGATRGAAIAITNRLKNENTNELEHVVADDENTIDRDSAHMLPWMLVEPSTKQMRQKCLCTELLLLFYAARLEDRKASWLSYLVDEFALMPLDVINQCQQALQESGLLSKAQLINPKMPVTSLHNIRHGVTAIEVPGSGKIISLSFYFRSFFTHRYCNEITTQQRELAEELKKVSKDKKMKSIGVDVIKERPGYVPLLADLVSQRAVDFPNFATNRYLSIKGSNNEPIEIGDDPVAVLHKLHVMQAGEQHISLDDDDDDAGTSMASKPDTKKKRYFAQSSGKSKAFDMSGLQIGHCSLMVALNSKASKALDEGKLLENDICELEDTFLTNRLDYNRLLDPNFDSWLLTEEKSIDRKINIAILKSIYNMVKVAEIAGVTFEEIEKMVQHESPGNEDEIENYLTILIRQGWILRVGVSSINYVAAEHARDWCVHTKIRDQNLSFMPRLWLRPDGAVNRPLLRYLCESIAMNLFARGADKVPENTFAELYRPALCRSALVQLLEHLQRIGCACRENIPMLKKPRIESPFDNAHVTTLRSDRLTCWSLSTNFVLKLNSAFSSVDRPIMLQYDQLNQQSGKKMSKKKSNDDD